MIMAAPDAKNAQIGVDMPEKSRFFGRLALIMLEIRSF